MSKNAIMPMDDYKGACDKVREKLGTEDLIKSGEMPEKIDKVFEAGKQQGTDEFWDLFQNYGKRKSYADAFYETAFEYIRPKYKVVPMSGPTDCARTFYNNDNLKKLEKEFFDFSLIPLGTYSGTGFYWTFGSCGALEEIEDIGLENQKYWQSTFLWCGNLRKIARICFRGDEHFDQTFHNCAKLEEVTFEGVIGTNGLSFQHSPLLTDATLRNIVGCLKDFSGTSETRSITFHADSVAKLETVTEIANEQSVVNGVVTKGNLIEGQTYKISWYDSTFPGWLTGTETDPSSDKVVIEAVAEKVTVNGTECTGIKITGRNYVSAGGILSYILYQDGENICAFSPVSFGGIDIISISAKSLKEIANDKGWTVVEV